MRARAVAALLSAGLLGAGCGLPLGGGVRTAGEVDAEQRLPEPISVLPPGPQPDATPEEVVEGFLAAQVSGRADHAIAREFLAERQRAGWDDDAGVWVHDPAGLRTRASRQGGDVVVRLELDVVGRVEPDGRAIVQLPGDSRRETHDYLLRRDAQGQWRLVDVPDGLTLSPADRARAFTARDVHFLAPAPPGVSARHLVADRVLLPSGDEAQALVERLLAGPSGGLGASAQSAAPAGTRLVRPVTVGADGEVLVDLSAPVGALGAPEREHLSAQLVWTLREVEGFSRLRLLVDGEPLEVAGSDEPQPSTSWQSYDPDGPDDDPPGYVVQDGALVALPEPQGGRPRDEPPELARVADAAVDPAGQRLAVLEQQPRGRRLLTGPLAGPLVPRTASSSWVSPSWGSGEHGVWLLRTGRQGTAPGLFVVPAEGDAREVAVELPDLGRVPVVRVARDGVRVAVVADGELLLGRVETDAGGRAARVVELTLMRSAVLDVAWETSTSLAVLVRDEQAPQLPLLRLSVDGTSAVESGLLGVGEGKPVAIAAFRDRPLLVETVLRERSTTYGEDGSRGFQVRAEDARRPSYPG